MLGVQRLAAWMKDRLRLLTTSRNPAAPARQQTLRAALQWSHGFLDAREQAVFRRLGVMAGSASLELVQQVVADETLDAWDVLDVMSALVDRSLVAVLDAEDDDAAPRYRLLDSSRALSTSAPSRRIQRSTPMRPLKQSSYAASSSAATASACRRCTASRSPAPSSCSSA